MGRTTYVSYAPVKRGGEFPDIAGAASLLVLRGAPTASSCRHPCLKVTMYRDREKNNPIHKLGGQNLERSIKIKASSIN